MVGMRGREALLDRQQRIQVLHTYRELDLEQHLNISILRVMLSTCTAFRVMTAEMSTNNLAASLRTSTIRLK